MLGHSAGGHLTATLIATDWPAQDATAPADLVPAGYAIPSVFDLVPLVQVPTNQGFRLDEAGARKLGWIQFRHLRYLTLTKQEPLLVPL
jgi:arylformamidase